MSSCLVRLFEKGNHLFPSGNWYQPGLIDPAIAGETEHLVGKPEIRMSVNLTLIPTRSKDGPWLIGIGY